jgi:ribonuclease BN (tRNA processing enzyme)
MADLVVLGSGTAIPTRRRASPGLLLRAEDAGTVLIDPGPGSLCRMAREGGAVEDVDRVLITHHHPDHTLDIMSLLFARRNPWLRPRLRRLVLVGPAGTRELHARMKGLYGQWIEAAAEEFEIVEAAEGPLPSAAGLTGRACRTEHTGESLGYRLELEAGTLAVSGDCGPADGLVALGEGADLFLLECAVPDDYPAVPGHLTPDGAGRIAARARPGKLVLYHLYPPVEAEEALESVRRHFHGDVSVAEDGAVYTL